MSVRNSRQPDGTGVPLPLKPRFDANGKPIIIDLDDVENRDSLETVKLYLINEYGQEEGTEKLRNMTVLEILALLQRIEDGDEDDNEGVPSMPRLRTVNGKLTISYR